MDLTSVYLLLFRWLAVNLEFLGNGVVLAAAILSVMGKDTLSPGIVGLAVSHSLQVRVIPKHLQSTAWDLNLISWSCHCILLSAFAIFCLTSKQIVPSCKSKSRFFLGDKETKSFSSGLTRFQTSSTDKNQAVFGYVSGDWHPQLDSAFMDGC